MNKTEKSRLVADRNYCISPEEYKALLIAAAPELLKLLCRFVANDHVLDELTSEAQALIDRLGGG